MRLAGMGFARFESHTLSEPEPIQSSLDEWGAEFDRGGDQYTFNELALGYRFSGYEFSVFQRAQLGTRVNDRAAEFYGRIKRDEPLPTGERVPVALAVDGIAGHGLRLGYAHESPGVDLALGVSVFRANRVMSGDLQGQFQALSPDEYQFSAAVDYRYRWDPLFERDNIESPEGIGWGLDLRAEWRMTDHWTLSGRGKDLLAAIRWRDLPYTRARADSQQRRTDDDGVTVFDPLLTGVEGYEDSHRQSIDPRFQGEIRYRSDRGWTLSGHYRRAFEVNRAGFGAGFLRDGQLLEARLWPDSEAVGLEARGRQWTLGLKLDSLDWEQVRALSVVVAWRP